MRSAPKSIGIRQAIWPPQDQENDQPAANQQTETDKKGKGKQQNGNMRKRSVKKMQKQSTSAESQQQHSDSDNQLIPRSQKKQHEYDDFYDVFEDNILPMRPRLAPESPVFGKNMFQVPENKQKNTNNKYAMNENFGFGDNYDFLNDEKTDKQLESIKQIQKQPIIVNKNSDEQIKEALAELSDGQIQESFVPDWCGFCDKAITESEQKQGNYTMLQSTNCFHNAHTECLKKAIRKERAENGFLNCPTCRRNIRDFELQAHVTEAEWKEVENFVARQILECNPNLKQCPCGNIMEFIKGDVDSNQKDDKGQLLSKEAATHMAEYRIRCNECQKSFCHKCKAQPYHLGKTCDQLNNILCRFCLDELKEWNQVGGPAFMNICKNQECQDLIKKSCDKILECGHPCGGIRGEEKCLPCLEPQCIAKMDILQAPNVDKDQLCTICFTTGLGQAPCIQLDCEHIVHHDCVIEQVKKGGNGARIVFNYLDCSQCKRELSCSNSDELNKVLKPQLKFKQLVQDKAMKRADYDNLKNDAKFLAPGNPYQGDLLKFAMNTLSYYQCFKCKDAYFVGRKDCGEDAQLDVNNLNKETLMCPKCAPQSVGGGITNCPTHGTEFIEFKCRFCCKRAIWFCWGTTHFCDPCHRKAYTLKNAPKEQLPKCKGKNCELKMPHPEPGDEFAMGCGLCAEKLERQAKSKDLGF